MINTRLTLTEIREDQWVARYVSGRLTEAENEAFEEYCINHPYMVGEVDLERRMRSALAQEAGQAPIEFPMPAPRRWFLPAAAAAALVLAFAFLIFTRPLDLSNTAVLASLQGLETEAPSLASVRLAQTRGFEPPTLGDASREVMLITLAGRFDQPGTYDVKLVSDPGEILASLLLTAASTQDLQLIMNGARVPAGSYRLRVVNVATADVQEFDFRKD